jgi:hypothetical protein
MTTRMGRRMNRVMAALVGLGLVAAVTFSYAGSPQGVVEIPPDAAALEGIPHVRIDVTQDGVTRRQLGAAEAAKDRLTITIVDGRLYRAGEDRPLFVTSSKDFVYLSSVEPGKYVRVRKLDDRYSYIEHMDMPFGSVTFWGELRIVIEQ